jgi:hypothetical protein
MLLNHLLLVHPQLVHLQPVGWIQNLVGENESQEYCIVLFYAKMLSLYFHPIIATVPIPL